jgi:hypothetical protein
MIKSGLSQTTEILSFEVRSAAKFAIVLMRNEQNELGQFRTKTPGLVQTVYFKRGVEKPGLT